MSAPTAKDRAEGQRVFGAIVDMIRATPNVPLARDIITAAIAMARREGGIAAKKRGSLVLRVVPKMVAAADRLIAENEATALSSWGPGEDWREEWQRDDSENAAAVADLQTWCRAIEEARTRDNEEPTP